MQPFSLLNLPTLVLGDTLKCLNPIELFNFSQCSTKMIEIIKLAGTRKFRLSADFRRKKISINNDYHFQVQPSYVFLKHIPKITEHRNFGDKYSENFVPVKMPIDNENILISFCYDEHNLLERIFFHLTDIFHCKVDTLITEPLHINKNCRAVVEETMDLQGEFRNFTIHSSDFAADEELKWALDSVKVTEKFEANHCYVHGSFKHNFVSPPKCLIINAATWFTFDNLLSLDSCVMIKLDVSILTNQDLGTFINLWKAGNYKKLKYMEVSDYQLDESELITGLTELRNTQNLIRRERRINGKIYEILNGVNIQSNDGIMATIELEEHCFKFLVWTD